MEPTTALRRVLVKVRAEGWTEDESNFDESTSILILMVRWTSVYPENTKLWSMKVSLKTVPMY
jgi:hypothetical protein